MAEDAKNDDKRLQRDWLFLKSVFQSRDGEHLLPKEKLSKSFVSI